MEYITVALVVICIGIETILTNSQIRDVLKIISNLECDIRFAESKIEWLEKQIKKEPTDEECERRSDGK